jgi:hypothetical protein
VHAEKFWKSNNSFAMSVRLSAWSK